MGILIQPPPNQSLLPYVRWSHAVVGVFFDNSPPTSSFVYNIVNNHWETRDPFVCYVRVRTLFLNVRISLIETSLFILTPLLWMVSQLHFEQVRITRFQQVSDSTWQVFWIRVQDLPWRFLEADWTLRLLSHVGHVEAIDNYGAGLPLDPFLRARVLVDLSRPLVWGCFVPLDDDRVSWVYFIYEGIYHFCRECGCVGHNTGRCNLSAYDAQWII